MRTTTWAILGSLAINLMLGVVVAAVFSAPPTATAAESAQCPSQAAAPSRPAPSQPAAPAQRYIVAVRMGWAMG